MIVEVSLDISIIAMVEMIMKVTDTPSEKFSFYLSFVLLNIIVFGVFYTYNIINNNMIKIKNPSEFKDFHNKWGVLWEF